MFSLVERPSAGPISINGCRRSAPAADQRLIVAEDGRRAARTSPVNSDGRSRACTAGWMAGKLDYCQRESSLKILPGDARNRFCQPAISRQGVTLPEPVPVAACR